MNTTTSNLDNQAEDNPYLPQNTSRKVDAADRSLLQAPGDDLWEWMDYYRQFAVAGVRSPAVAQKIALHLVRFHTFFVSSYGHDRASTCLRRDVLAWQTQLREQSLSAATRSCKTVRRAWQTDRRYQGGGTAG